MRRPLLRARPLPLQAPTAFVRIRRGGVRQCMPAANLSRGCGVVRSTKRR